MGSVKLAFEPEEVGEDARQLRLNTLRRLANRGQNQEKPQSINSGPAAYPGARPNSTAQELVKINSPPAPSSTALSKILDKPKRPGWQLRRVIAGHAGWVNCLAVDVDNQWFVTGSADTTIKAWDLATGDLKLTLTGHKLGVRSLALSERMPYLFSGGEDKAVRCWDLEYNRVVRDYHGHLSGVYAMALHPELNILVTAGRDQSPRVWDIRTRNAVHVLAGHSDAVYSVACQDAEPQVLSGSADRTIRLWDLAAGRSRHVLTHPTSSVRAFALHPNEYTFASAGHDAIRQYQFPEGALIGDIQQNQKTQCLALNAEQNLLVAGSDNGNIQWLDWTSGEVLGETVSPLMPGSLESERSILCAALDHSGSRLLTGEMDKTIKVWAPEEQD